MAALVWVIALLVWNIAEASALIPEANEYRWKALLVAGSAYEGEATIENWDRAREGVHRLLLDSGVEPGNIRALTTMPRYEGTTAYGVSLHWATIANMRAALESLQLSTGDALFLFITSHGSPDEGIVLERGGRESPRMLSVARLSALLDELVGDLPAVILLSACYSGQFLAGDEGLGADNRVVMTAARHDRSSFGCGSGSLMPHWDESLIDALQGAAFRRVGSRERSWTEIARRVEAAIADRERGFAESSRSYPQASIGRLFDDR